MKRVLCIAVTLCLLAAACSHPEPANKTPLPTRAPVPTRVPLSAGLEDYYIRQGPAYQAGKEIIAKLGIYDLEARGWLYPVDYCGQYYNREKDKMVIMLTDLTDTRRYLNSTQYSSYLAFETAKYSMNQLIACAKEASAVFEKLFSHVMVHPNTDEQKNNVLVLTVEEDYKALVETDLEEIGLLHLAEVIEYGTYTLYPAFPASPAPPAPNNTATGNSETLTSPIVTEFNYQMVSIVMDDLYRNLLWAYSYDGSLYPEDYAGYYYQQSPPKLVLCLTDDANKQKYYDATNYDEYIEIKIVNYSLNTLREYRPVVQAAYDAYFEHILVDPSFEDNCLMVRALEKDFERVSSRSLEELGIENLKEMIQFGLWHH